ncbi:spore photoproduct lyase family protein [Leptolyngbya sp. GB1-A1]|nr:spore photoproduct lyase family protein [Leptolyngbya sp. FACHB-711]
MHTAPTATDLQINAEINAPIAAPASSGGNSTPEDISLNRLLQVKEIYYEPAVLEYGRGQEILSRYPNARQVEVASHWKIPDLHANEDSVEHWNLIKRTVLVLGVKKSIQVRPNDRSADFIAPSHSNGCAMACSYCFVARRKGFANPITTFVNIEQIQKYLKRHAARQGEKTISSQTDPQNWVYEIGENSDCSVDAAICDNVKDLITLFRDIPNAKATFATKRVNRDLLNYDPQGKTRIRFSVMPQSIAQVVDIRTSSIDDRINAVNDFVSAGYEVHLNFAPVIYHENWKENYTALFQQIDDTLSPTAKAQLQSEVIFLTHNEGLHSVNMGWHPQGENLLWRPDLQEPKYSQNGDVNVRYKRGFKGQLVSSFCDLLKQHLPYCNIRYAF